jgi:replicative DNA helicase
MFDEYIPVHSKEAEMCVLGSMMLSEKAISEVGQIITAEDFYQPSHKLVFQAIQQLAAKGSAADLVTVRNSLQESGSLEMCGGVPYLVEVANSTPSALNAKEYAEIVKEKSLMRSLESAGQEIIRLSRDPELEIHQRIDRALELVANVSNSRVGMIQPVSMAQCVADFIARTDELYDNGVVAPRVRTGFSALDAIIDGLYPGQYTVIGARMAMGKTAFLISMALNMARDGHRVRFYSLEMTKDQIVTRAISQRSDVPAWNIKNQLNDRQFQAVNDAANEIHNLPIDFVDPDSLHVERLVSQVKGIPAKELPEVILLDYAQLLEASGKFGTDAERKAFISNQLRGLAKSTGCHVAALVQMGRTTTNRANNRPTLADIADSDRFARDAHNVILLHRESYYRNESPDEDELEAIVAKNREGKVGTAHLAMVMRTTRVGDQG